MAKTIKSEVFDAANFLDNKEVLKEYLNIALESEDPKELLRAQDTVARAKYTLITSISQDEVIQHAIVSSQRPLYYVERNSK